MLQGLTRMAPDREGEQPTNSDTTSIECRLSGGIAPLLAPPAPLAAPPEGPCLVGAGLVGSEAGCPAPHADSRCRGPGYMGTPTQTQAALRSNAACGGSPAAHLPAHHILVRD